MIREAEMEDMEKKWAAQNDKIMSEHPDGGPEEMEQTGAYPSPKKGDAKPSEADKPPVPAASAEAAAAPTADPAAEPTAKSVAKPDDAGDGSDEKKAG